MNCQQSACGWNTAGFTNPGCPVHELVEHCNTNDASLSQVPVCGASPISTGALCESDGIGSCHNGGPVTSRPCGRLEIFVRVPCETIKGPPSSPPHEPPPGLPPTLSPTSPPPSVSCKTACDPYDLSTTEVVVSYATKNATSALGDLARCLTCPQEPGKNLRALILEGIGDDFGSLASGNKGAIALATALRSATPQLQVLRLVANHSIGSDGCVALVQQLALAPAPLVQFHVAGGTIAADTRCHDALGKLLFEGALPAMQSFSLPSNELSSFS